jgi:hypothetical protein
MFTTIRASPLLAAFLLSIVDAASGLNCTSNTFSSLTLSTIEILSLNVTSMYNVSTDSSSSAAGTGVGIVSASTGQTSNTTDMCLIAIRYTHPGQHDTVNTWVGLPLESAAWNSRFMMSGGGGWTAGAESVVLSPVAAGYSSSSTDGGHNASATTAEWGLVSEGNTNWPALNDFASVALDDAARLGLLATELYYGSKPKWSYWNGCSTGGRQGHMMAQRYPEHFDGILASCSAINWQTFQSTSIVGNYMAVRLGPSSVLR